MDVLSCPACGSLFYSAASGAHRCPKCAEQLNLELSPVTSIPLEARWLGADRGNGSGAPITVLLRRRRVGEIGNRIATELGTYFETTPVGSSVEVSVEAAAVGPPALRVAAILDGIDRRWEQHFHLPDQPST